MTTDERARVTDLIRRSVHSRARPGYRLPGFITFYGVDATSPTGVSRIGSCPLTDEYEDLIRAVNGSISPLSPTER
jgi:hypothetical protein